MPIASADIMILALSWMHVGIVRDLYSSIGVA